MSKQLRITLIKSEIGHTKDQRRTIRALGLHRLNQSVEHENMPSIRGMVGKVRHLVKTIELEEGTKANEAK
ncbi:MAG: 50S ribosomal protein L30 [Dehalococcoidia bacterium]|nr:50S ribosomal protein L30 [Dehalococcoidia bacterium]